MFYEAIGIMINAVSDSAKKEKYLKSLMVLPNELWTQIMHNARTNANVLVDPLMIRRINELLKTNIAVCNTMGGGFLPQLQAIDKELVQVYRHHSQALSNYLKAHGEAGCAHTQAKILRNVRNSALKLYTTFIQAKTSSNVIIGDTFVPSLMDTVLLDYETSIPDAREQEVLRLFATIVAKLGADKASHNLMLSHVPRIFQHTFQVTLQTITTNFEVYPEHRLAFYQLLKNIIDHCFESILAFNEYQTQMVVDSVVWGFRHTERNIAETGMGLFLSMITKYANSPKCNSFFERYHLKLVQELFAVLTDTFHKPNFKLHAMTLQRLIMIAESPHLTVQLWSSASSPLNAQQQKHRFSSNSEFLHHYMILLLQQAFPNIHPTEVKVFVDGLYSAKREPPKFKQYIRDFIVRTKEFSNLDNKELYAEEQAEAEALQRQQLLSVPGMAPPE